MSVSTSKSHFLQIFFLAMAAISSSCSEKQKRPKTYVTKDGLCTYTTTTEISHIMRSTEDLKKYFRPEKVNSSKKRQQKLKEFLKNLKNKMTRYQEITCKEQGEEKEININAYLLIPLYNKLFTQLKIAEEFTVLCSTELLYNTTKYLEGQNKLDQLMQEVLPNDYIWQEGMEKIQKLSNELMKKLEHINNMEDNFNGRCLYNKETRKDALLDLSTFSKFDFYHEEKERLVQLQELLDNIIQAHQDQ